MSDNLATIVPKLLPLLRMLGSGADGEIVNSVRIMRQLLKNAGTDIHALVDRIQSPAPSSNDLAREFERGRIVGRAEVSATTRSFGGNGVGDGVNGFSWCAIAQHLQANAWRMSGFEKEFSENIAIQLRYRAPSEKQAAILHRIFVNRFGGRTS